MAEGFGRNEILSLIAGGALAVPALLGAVAMLYLVGQVPDLSRRVEGISVQVPWRKPAAPATGRPHAAPTPMAVPHPPRVPHPLPVARLAPPVRAAGPATARAKSTAHHPRPVAPPRAPAAGHGKSSAALAAMRVAHDAMSGQVSYVDQATDPSDRSATGLHCYVVKAGHGPPTLRLRVRWVDRKHAERLGLEGLYFHVDGRRYAIDNPPYGLLEVQGDVSVTAEHAWEWYDTQVDRRRQAMLRAIAGSRSAVIRFDGSHGQAKHVVTPAEKAAIARVLAAYDSLASEG